jgi:hypothetical protein
MLQSWVENLIDNFSGDETNCYFQGDGDAWTVTKELAAGIPRRALMDGSQKTYYQLYLYQLDNLKAQKESSNYLVSESDRAQEAQHANLMNNINRVTSGMFQSFLVSFTFLTFLTAFYKLFFLFYLSGSPPTRIDSSTKRQISNSSISNITDGENFFSPLPQGANQSKLKSPPSVKFPLPCLKCDENNKEMTKVEMDSKTVFCRSCKHVADASEYNVMDFTWACLYDKKEASTATGFKKHAETVYLSCLADIKRQDNERLMLSLKEKELDICLQEQQHSYKEKASRLDLELKLKAQRFTNQEQMFKIQANGMAAMQQIVTHIIPKKSPLDNYNEHKAAIAAMLAAGDISVEVANELIGKLNNELFSSNLMS